MDILKDEKAACRNCNSCKHFFKHYVKHPNGFYEIRYGHCGARKVQRFFMPEEIVDCKFWEPAEDRAEKSKKTIKSILEKIETNLKDVKDILTCSEEYD